MIGWVVHRLFCDLVGNWQVSCWNYLLLNLQNCWQMFGKSYTQKMQAFKIVHWLIHVWVTTSSTLNQSEHMACHQFSCPLEVEQQIYSCPLSGHYIRWATKHSTNGQPFSNFNSELYDLWCTWAGQLSVSQLGNRWA